MKLFSLNTIGVSLVVIGFLISLGRVMAVSGVIDPSDKHIIRVAHWQLEPGYREAMDAVMESYNNLPHIQAKNIQVQQAPITEKFYAQWLNTHLVAGTAPDINERGMAALTRGTNAAKYFEPLGAYVVQPNPYNARAYLPEEIEPELAEFLETAPWRETFLDGMEGGYDDDLQDYYAVPTSFWGSVKMYINVEMMREVKDVAIDALGRDPLPEGLAALFEQGYARRDADLEAWLSGDQAPQTLGQLFVLCEATYLYGQQTGQTKLVPIAGSSYSEWMFAGVYALPFTSHLAPAVDRNGDGSLTRVELAEGLLNDQWSFENEALEAFHACIRKVCTYFPPGFLALERDQANNRFVLSRALMIASGAWDANSLIEGAQAHDDPEDRFSIVIANFPLPGPGEKWGDIVSERASEASSNAGAPYQVYQRSEYKQEAIDFIQYLTSMPVNERFNKIANWLPVTIGAAPAEQMLPFAVSPDGIFPNMRISPQDMQGTIATRYRGMMSQFLAGDVTYRQLVDAVQDTLNRPVVGLDELFWKSYETERDGIRNLERSIAGQDIRGLLLDADDASEQRQSLVSISVRRLNATEVRQAWQRVNPDRPFPDRH
jgi:raffinose/stachyose/melibiose transport system substrate-binding protein